MKKGLLSAVLIVLALTVLITGCNSRQTEPVADSRYCLYILRMARVSFDFVAYLSHKSVNIFSMISIFRTPYRT